MVNSCITPGCTLLAEYQESIFGLIVRAKAETQSCLEPELFIPKLGPLPPFYCHPFKKPREICRFPQLVFPLKTPATPVLLQTVSEELPEAGFT